jgi:hypothetical protein
MDMDIDELSAAYAIEGWKRTTTVLGSLYRHVWTDSRGVVRADGTEQRDARKGSRPSITLYGFEGPTPRGGNALCSFWGREAVFLIALGVK